MRKLYQELLERNHFPIVMKCATRNGWQIDLGSDRVNL